MTSQTVISPITRPMPDILAVRATVAMLLSTKRTPRGLRELGAYSATYGPLDTMDEERTYAVAAFYDAVEREYWRRCPDPINVKSDEFDFLFDRTGDVCVAEGENHVCIIPARVVQALGALIDTDNQVIGWLDRIYRQLEQEDGGLPADVLAEQTNRQDIINAKRRRIEHDIIARFPRPKNDNEAEALQNEIDRCQALIRFNQAAGYTDRADFWRTELATYQRDLAEVLAEQAQAGRLAPNDPIIPPVDVATAVAVQNPTTGEWGMLTNGQFVPADSEQQARMMVQGYHTKLESEE